MIKRALLSVFFGGCLVAAGLALSPSQNVIILGPRQNAMGPTRIPGREVFSWYISYEYVYSTYNAPVGDATAIAGYKHDIQDAIAGGVDGFELFYINRIDLYNSISNMFEAAKQLHDADPSKPPFLLFLSPEASAPTEVNQIFPGTSSNWIYYFVNIFASHPNYYHYQGKAVLGSFLGLDQQTDWTNLVFTPLHNAGIDVFFIPSVFDASAVTTGGTTLTAWGQANIGSLNYWTGSNPTTDISGTNNLVNINQLNGKPVVVDLSGASYWSVNTSPSAGVYFEHYGAEGPDQEWRNAISLNPIFIIETTWNDWTESYTSPVDIPNVSTVSSGYNIESLLKPHSGYNELRKYYAQWYTTGIQPTIAKDLLMYFYRTSAQSLNTFSPLPTFNPATIPDNLFVATRLTAPATLSVSTGGNVTTYNLPAGVNFTQIPFTAGAQQFQLIRGNIIISISGEAVLSSITANNLEWTTGFAYAVGNPFVTGQTLGPTLRNNFNGGAGFKFTVSNSPITD